MKRLILIAGILVWGGLCLGIQIPETENYILTEDSQQVLDTQGINDPIRDGAFLVIDTDPNSSGSGELGGILGVDDPITDHATAKNKTLQLVKNIINYLLTFLAVIALIYLIYNGFLILTAMGDETQYKKGIKSLQYAVIAIAGIAASRLFVSLIFRLINYITGP